MRGNLARRAWPGEFGKFAGVLPLADRVGVKLRKINIHRLTFGGQVAKSIRTLELNFNFLSSVLHMTIWQDRKRVSQDKPYDGKAAGRKAGMNKFLFAVMAGMSQVRRQSVYSMGEVRA